MNRTIVLFHMIMSLIFVALDLSSQCPENGLELLTQNQVDSFTINYSGCDSMHHVLEIGYVRHATNLKSDITDLSPLSGLAYIRNLQIWNNEYLQTLSGLDIEGAKSISIWYNDALIDLEGLNEMTDLEHSISIQHNPVLTSLNGLNNLTDVGTSFAINNCDDLTSINLPNLDRVGGTMFLSSNDQLSLVTFSGLSDLDGLSINNNDILNQQINIPLVDSLSDVLIKNSDAMTSLSFLQNIDEVSGAWHIENNPMLVNFNIPALCQSIIKNPVEVLIEDNGPGSETLNEVQVQCGVTSDCPQGYYFYDQLTIDAFKAMYPNCKKVQGNIHIKGDRGFDIVRFDSLKGITSISGTLHIEDNHGLVTLEGLDNIDSIGVDLKIDGNFEIQDYQGLRNLKYIGRDLISNYSTKIVNLQGLEHIKEIKGDIRVTNNYELINFVGLDSVTTVGGEILSQWNQSQVNFEGLNQLERIGEDFKILNARDFVDFQGVPQLRTIGRTFWVSTSPAFKNFNGLSSLNKIGLSFFMTNDHVKNFTGLESLDSIVGYIHINGCDSLENLTGLSKLHFVNNLTIYNSTSLESLEGLESLTKIDSSITISGNLKLQECAVLPICNSLQLPHTEVNIQNNNNIGCNSAAEVLSLCELRPCPSVSIIEWTGTAGDHDWHNANNWDLSRLPEDCDRVIISVPDSVNISSDVICYDLTIDTETELIFALNTELIITCMQE